MSYDFVAAKPPGQGEAAGSGYGYVLSVSPCVVDDPAKIGVPSELMRKLLRNSALGQPPQTILEARARKSASTLNRDLQAAVASHLVRTQLPVQLQFDATPVTTITSLATLKILVPADALLQPTADAHRAVNFKAYGQFENTVSGRIESWFECDTSPQSPVHAGQQMQWVIACEKPLILPAGVYELRVAAKEDASQIYGTASATVAVPGYVAESPSGERSAE